jgi:hypothetical protein
MALNALIIDLVFVLLVFNPWTVCGQVVSQIVSPKDGERIYQHNVKVRGHIEVSDGSFLHLCWKLHSHFLGETTTYCSAFNEEWNDSNLVDVPLPNRGRYELSLSVYKLSDPNVFMVDAVKDLVSESHATFTIEIPEACQSILKERRYTQPRYYDQVINKGPINGVRNELSLDLEVDQWVNFERAPLCFDHWIIEGQTRDNVLRSMVSVTSASRGMFGVDFSMQQFGHGDSMMLDFVLDRHRHAAPHYVEMGTFGGVTALYLGMAARLRGGLLDTFDISDDRSDEVKLAWLPNMMFHLGDANSFTTPTTSVSTALEAVAAIKQAGIVLVDHADRLNFTM